MSSLIRQTDQAIAVARQQLDLAERQLVHWIQVRKSLEQLPASAVNQDKEVIWLCPKDAAHRAGISEDTAIRWAKQHNLGRLFGGRWRIDAALLQKHLSK